MTSRALPLIFKKGFAQQHDTIIEPAVLIKKNKGVFKFILNRPKRLNALDMEMANIMYPNLQTWEALDDAKAIFFKGVGRALCAGGHLKDVINCVKDPKKHSLLEHEVSKGYEMFHFIGTMETPYIAVMDGITMGAGGGMCGFAPFRIATENTQFAMPETTIGHFCDMGSSFFLSRLDGYLGAYLGATSRIVKGEDVLFSGLATHFVPSSRIKELEDHLAGIENLTHKMVHQTIEKFAVEKDHKPAFCTLHGDHRKIIDHCFQHETMEEVVAALKEDGSKFSTDTLYTIMKRSPRCLKVTHEHLRRAKKLSFKECLRMEHHLWQTVPFEHDFVEGVTAHVINRKQPEWSPSKLEDVDLDGDIRAKLFHANSNVWRKLQFLNDRDYHIAPYRRYALPSEEEILEVKSKQNLTKEGTVAWFEKERNNKFGVRHKVEDVINRSFC